jgi:hypothetical protein
MIGVYGALSLGAIDIAFSLTRFLIVELTHTGDFRAITTIGTFSYLLHSSPFPLHTGILAPDIRRPRAYSLQQSPFTIYQTPLTLNHPELWSSLDMMVGLIVACLPSLRPYLRHGFKASSADISHGPSNSFGASQSIVVNRKIITTTTSGRWKEHGEFEEIIGDEGDSSVRGKDGHGRIITIGNDVQVNGGRIDTRSGGRDSWQDDKRSNNSDIELIQVKGSV